LTVVTYLNLVDLPAEQTVVILGGIPGVGGKLEAYVYGLVSVVGQVKIYLDPAMLSPGPARDSRSLPVNTTKTPQAVTGISRYRFGQHFPATSSVSTYPHVNSIPSIVITVIVGGPSRVFNGVSMMKRQLELRSGQCDGIGFQYHMPVIVISTGIESSCVGHPPALSGSPVGVPLIQVPVCFIVRPLTLAYGI